MFELQFFLFCLVAGVTGLCAIATVITQNIVRSATWLLFTLGGTSAVFFLLGADFVGAIQLLIYVGGTMVLVVFGVMLTAQGPFINMKTSGAEWAISVVAGITLFAVLCFGVASFLQDPSPPADVNKAQVARREKPAVADPKDSNHAATIGMALTGGGYGPEYKAPATDRIYYLLPFEIVSVHLLVVLIGAAYLARAKRRQGETP